jgi:hypothetical protein
MIRIILSALVILYFYSPFSHAREIKTDQATVNIEGRLLGPFQGGVDGQRDQLQGKIIEVVLSALPSSFEKDVEYACALVTDDNEAFKCLIFAMDDDEDAYDAVTFELRHSENKGFKVSDVKKWSYK